MGWRRRLAIVLAVTGACGLVLWVASSEEDDRVPAGIDAKRAPLGERFEGHVLEEILRTGNRSKVVSYIYGTCTPPEGEGGCAPPLEVQVSSACGGRHRVFGQDAQLRRRAENALRRLRPEAIDLAGPGNRCPGKR